MTHATPASFTAHTGERDLEEDIAYMQTYNFSHAADLLFGGGRSQFNNRTDQLDLVSVFRENNVTVVMTEEAMMAQKSLPVVGLFASSHMSYEIDRMQNPLTTEPTLSKMVQKALDLLSSNPDGKPFVLIIEAGRIDHASHSNDAATHYWEMNQYMKTIQVLETFLSDRSDTSVLMTSDHSTGGISTGRNVGIENPSYPPYTWYPDVLLRVNSSMELIAKRIMNGGDLESVYLEYTGIDLQQVVPKYVRKILFLLELVMARERFCVERR